MEEDFDIDLDTEAEKHISAIDSCNCYFCIKAQELLIHFEDPDVDDIKNRFL